MTSNLACLGMGVQSPAELDELVAQITRLGHEPVGETHGVRTFAWQDDSGARVVYDVLAGRPLILPSFAAQTEVSYTALDVVSPDVARVTVLGEDGSTETGVTCELEQRRHPAGYPRQGRIRLVALGINVECFLDEATFLAADASLLGSEDEPGPPPPEVEQRGLAWPPRMSASAFFANGFYPGPVDPTPHALMSGHVLRAEQRTNALTGRRFVAARVRTAFGELDLCLADGEHEDLTPGRVVAGTVAVVGRLLGAPPVLDPEPGLDAPHVLDPEPARPADPVETNHREPADDAPLPGETRRAWRERTAAAERPEP